jgi:hypothetical protein
MPSHADTLPSPSHTLLWHYFPYLYLHSCMTMGWVGEGGSPSSCTLTLPTHSCSKTHARKLTTNSTKYRIQNTEYRIQNTEYRHSFTQNYHCFFLWRLDLMIRMREIHYSGHCKGWVGPENLDSLPFQGPKKSQFSGPTPSNGPRNGFSRIKIITVPPSPHKQQVH